MRHMIRTALSVLATMASLALGVACGISLSAERNSELFQELVMPKRVAPGAEVSLAIAYEQPYPVAIEVECDIFEKGRELKEGERGQVFFTTVFLSNPQGGPTDEATPVAGTARTTFVAPRSPGAYVVRCLTPNDENNAIAESLEVVAGGG